MVINLTHAGQDDQDGEGEKEECIESAGKFLFKGL